MTLLALALACRCADPPPPTPIEAHYPEARAIFDAAVAGDVHAARRAAKDLDTTGGGAGLEGAVGYLITAVDAAEVAEAAALVAGACGDCHARAGGIGVAAPPTPPAGPLPARWHARGAEWLWLGLAGPSEEAFRAGASMIGRSEIEGGEAARLAAVGAGLASGSARVEAVGATIAICAGCHGG